MNILVGFQLYNLFEAFVYELSNLTKKKSESTVSRLTRATYRMAMP